MFKKKPQIKTLSHLRSSDRRKLADRIIRDYRLEAEPNGDQVDPEAKAQATAAKTALRASLLPENSLSARFMITTGPDLKEVWGVVYVGSHEAREQRVLWIETNNKLYPTVYTLWQNPGIVPLLHVPSLVVGKIENGADVMTPGLAGPPFPPAATKDAIVAVGSLDRPSVPAAVGTALVDISALKETRGVKGVAIEILHWAGDEVWDWSTSGKPGVTAPDSIEGWDASPSVSGGVRELSLNDEAEGGVALTSERVEAQQNEQPAEQTPLVEEVDDSDFHMSVDEIDHAFRNAFLYGVYDAKRNNPSKPKYGLDLPLSQSGFMQQLVLPYLPIFSPGQAAVLQMKNTSWKKATKFLKSLHKEKLILTKDRVTNEADVWDIDFDDRAFLDFQPYQLPKKGSGMDQTRTEQGKTSKQAAGSDESLGQTLKVVDLYRPKDAVSALFKAGGPKAQYTKPEISSAIADYLEKEELVAANNKRQVKLNPVLANALFSKGTNLDREALDKGVVNRDALLDRVLEVGCNQFHAVLRNEETKLDPPFSGSSVKAKAGAAPKVEILVEKVTGNKRATRVHGLETFFVNPSLLADELRKTCASSTSVEPFKGGRGTMEVMVQGPQTESVVRALEKRGVHKKWITVTDKSAKKGGGS